MIKKISVIIITLCSFLFSETNLIPFQDQEMYGQEQLYKDARQLAKTLEAVHPDPYINGGGKIAFHRRFQNLLASINKDGMTKVQFRALLLPFAAAIGDSHTGILPGEQERAQGPGLPLKFQVVENKLYIAAVQKKEHNSLIGATLASIEGISCEELLRRQSRLRGIENLYGKLVFLSINLGRKNGLLSLLPEWNSSDPLKVVLQKENEEANQILIKLPAAPADNWILPDSKIKNPSTSQSDMAFNFLDSDKKTALLVIDNMMRYREGCESWFASGHSEALAMSQVAYQYFHKKAPPDTKEELLAEIPSATETFLALVQEMQKAGADNLIVDLRKNTGGNSGMRDILVYFLFGKEALESQNGGYQIKKYSNLYFQTYASDSLEKINSGQQVSLTENDYDFLEERQVLEKKGHEQNLFQAKEEFLKRMSTFWEVYKTGTYHNPLYTPGKIVVLCSPWTYSSGFNMLTSLYDSGATILGTPSAQPGNNFGDSLLFKLNNTGLRCFVSFKRIITFPDDEAKGHVLRPHFEMTYDILSSYNFDPNAEILWAIEILNRRK
ncbi:S41 family peptidase [Acidobacteriota bacterium]